MKINVMQELTNFNGEVLQDANGAVTVRSIFETAINNQADGEVVTAEKKYQLYTLGNKLWADKEMKITSEEASLLKERVGALFTPIVYGRICDIIEGEDAPKE